MSISSIPLLASASTLVRALRHRLAVVAAALVALVFCWKALLPDFGQELIPQVHQG